MARIVAVTGLAVTRCASAVWLLARPAAVARAVSGQEPVPATWLIRLLGTRLLLQGVVELVWPDRRVVAIGQAVDALHATSMIGVAALRPRRGRAARRAIAQRL